jgi:uncharacterized short protein YbdD (DUF466 family)
MLLFYSMILFLVDREAFLYESKILVGCNKYDKYVGKKQQVRFNNHRTDEQKQ